MNYLADGQSRLNAMIEMVKKGDAKVVVKLDTNELIDGRSYLTLDNDGFWHVDVASAFYGTILLNNKHTNYYKEIYALPEKD